MKVGESQARVCEAINVWRRDFAPVATQVGKAHVVTHDEDDVGARVRGNLIGNTNKDDRREQGF